MQEPTEQKVEISTEEKLEDNMLKSCCGLVMDKNAVQYFTQVTIICSIMSFCICKLSTDDTCPSQTTFMGLLTMMIGLALPSPMFTKNKK